MIDIAVVYDESTLCFETHDESPAVEFVQTGDDEGIAGLFPNDWSYYTSWTTGDKIGLHTPYASAVTMLENCYGCHFDML